MKAFAQPRTTSWCCSTATCASNRISSPRCSRRSRDEKVFAVSCQIFFSDPAKLREETGLTQGWWENGGLRVRHRIDAGDRGSLPLLLRRRRILRVRSPQVSRAGRIRRAAPALLSRRHRPRLSSVEARLEGPLPAAQRRLPRTSRYHRKAVLAATDRPGPQEEFHPVLLEKHSRMAASLVPFLFHFRRRGAQRVLWRFAGAGQPRRTMAGSRATCRRRSVRALVLAP